RPGPRDLARGQRGGGAGRSGGGRRPVPAGLPQARAHRPRPRVPRVSDTPARLVVDDIEDNRALLIARLRRLGYTDVTEAEDGRKALDALSARAFDLVLLDVMMPELNGYQVLEHLRADGRLASLPVIMVSALAEMESVGRCIELGAEDYLHKP